MPVVIGSWKMSAEQADEQRAGLEGIVAGVRRLPGLVSGFWTSSTDGLDSHTFIVFEGIDAAEAFASNVRANLDNQRRGCRERQFDDRGNHRPYLGIADVDPEDR